jgi:glycine/D-amino acid oxidase-like deaminating enzyme/nitrite reductase/ring-hydroxylating ferredoxin subunit
MEKVPIAGRAGLRFADQAAFNPALYLRGVAAAAVREGAVIHEQSAPVFTGDASELDCNGHRVRADWVVMATHNPHAGRMSAAAASLLQTRLALYTTFVVRAVSATRVEPGLYWDTSDPYRYLRIDAMPDGVSLIAGGGDCKTGQHGDAREPLRGNETWLRRLFPDARVTHGWAGQVIETPDAMPFIGQVGNRQWIATGFAGNGMTFGTLAAMMVRDGVLGIENRWTDVVAPDRPAVRRAPWDYIRENLDYPYYMLRRAFGREATSSVESIGPGQGALVELGGQTVAVARDEGGRCHFLSPTCTHLGCTVGWNALARSWDCPCHGSRFAVDGAVLAGPAERPLPPPR